MKKILSYIMIFLFVLTVFAGVNLNVALANVSILNITVTPSTMNANAGYQISIQPHARVNIGQKIYIKFPSPAYSLPSTINTNDVYIATNHPSAISVDSDTITLTLGVAIPANYSVLIDFSLLADIVNPVIPSTYSIEVWTDAEPTHVPGSFVITVSGGGGSSVSGLTAYVSPVDSGKEADYLLRFNVSNDGALVSGVGYVDVYFPGGTILPENPDPSKVRMKNFPCTDVSVNEQRVRVYVPSVLGIIPSGAECNIDFTEAFGIKNPEQPGNYNLQVATSKDTGIAISNAYTIVGTSITNFSITVNPASQSTVAEYRAVFNTSTTGNLVSGTGKINVIFPDEVTLPSSIIPGAITVNGIPCTSIEKIGNHKLVIAVPVNISVSTQVTVIISVNFGIKNPEVTGTYELSVYTSMDTSIMNENFTITTSQITQLTVQLSKTSAGQTSSYIISFTTGASGALSGGIDRINVIFPLGTTIPLTIPISTVTVNNIPTTYVTVYGTTVTITVPSSIPVNSSVTVILSEDAGIKNPVNGGPYFLYVNTTKEASSVASAPYTIYIVPVTTLTVTPQVPDGLNGFYITQPVTALTASSSIDTNPFIYYYFDNNSPVLYNRQPFNVAEGIHTLFYYAVDHQGHQESAKSMQFKVDTILPQLVVTSPEDNAILNNRAVAVSGTVDVGSMVKVEGQDVPVNKAGHFSATTQISGDSAIITIVAIDLAGNSTQKILHVTLDTTPPELTVATPVPFQEVHRLPLQVKGTTEPGATVTVNDSNITVEADGSFLYELSELGEGEMFIIKVVAKDVAGNMTKKNINVKYVKTTTIMLQIDNKNAAINGKTVALDTPPIIKDGRTLVPLRFISEAFGAEITWDPVFQIIDITLGNDIIRLQIGKNFSSVNNKKFAMDTAPIIDHGRTMVPIRFVSEALNAEVLWDGETKTVTVIYPKP